MMEVERFRRRRRAQQLVKHWMRIVVVFMVTTELSSSYTLRLVGVAVRTRWNGGKQSVSDFHQVILL